MFLKANVGRPLRLRLRLDREKRWEPAPGMEMRKKIFKIELIYFYPSSGHVKCFAGAVYQLVDGLHCKIECHKFTNWPQSGECGAHCQSGKSHFSDWRVHHPLVPIFLPKAFADLQILRTE